MHKETGRFHSPLEMEAMVKDGTSPDSFIQFHIGENIEIKGHVFVVANIKNNRLVLRSAKSTPSVKEWRLENYKQSGKERKKLTIKNP